MALDLYGTDDPDFNEGHPEDYCPVCEHPVVDHPYWVGGQARGRRALWSHRWAAFRASHGGDQ